MVHALCGFMLVLWLLLSCTHAQTQTLAFPTAEGFGRFAQGGRGGRVIQVTNLNSSGPGSFRACLEATGPRTCIFRVGGIIDMGHCEACILGSEGTNHINPYLTIAGQTAPGDGIMIKGMELSMYTTHDIIIRHLRVRSGEIGSSFGAIEAGYGSHDIIVDHYSAGWASDDTIGAQGSSNITFQWGIVSEGIGDPPDTGDPRSKVGGFGQNVSFLHNYWAHYDWRVVTTDGGNVQNINNVVYNTQLGAWINPGYNGTPPAFVEFVNNYYMRGPASDADQKEPGLDFTGCGWPGSDCTVDRASRLYLSGNYQSAVRPDNSYPEDAFVGCQGECPTIVSSGFGFPTIPTLVSAQQARIDVLAKAGAMVPRRDSIDQRAINSIINNSGSICNSFHSGDVNCYGGYPVYNSGTPYPDADGDGMDDNWEVAHGLNPNDPSDGPRMATNGYTNLENFLNELAGDNVFGTTILPAPTNLRVTSQSQ